MASVEAVTRQGATDGTDQGWDIETLFVAFMSTVFAFVVLVCFPVGLWLQYNLAHSARAAREAARAVLADASYRERAVQAGYRIEERVSDNADRVFAICARANATGPIPCDPAPRPDGLAGELMRVIP